MPSSSANALIPGRSRVYVGQSVPMVAAPRRERSVGGRLGRRLRRLFAEVVVGARALLLLREGDVEVEVEVAVVRRSPREAQTHAPLVRLQLVERRAGHSPE